jgi:hypothetical protein
MRHDLNFVIHDIRISDLKALSNNPCFEALDRFYNPGAGDLSALAQKTKYVPEKEKKKKVFRGPSVWVTTIVRLSVCRRKSVSHFWAREIARAL